MATQIADAQAVASGSTPRDRIDRFKGAYAERIAVKTRARQLAIPVWEICCIAAEENYVRICTAAASYLLRETMARMEERLDPQRFVRVHRCAIVNLAHVRDVRNQSRNDFVIQLVNGQTVAMSRSHQARISQILAHRRNNLSGSSAHRVTSETAFPTTGFSGGDAYAQVSGDSAQA